MADMTKQQAKELIEQLVERFDYHAADYRKGNYNETQTRNDFINQFFEALGWDVNNRQGLAECYREVIHEDKISISGSTKAPDYCFTVYGQRKFFLEAKKPSVNIKEQAEPAYQLRRYGWSAKMPISLITDFEELAIYDCTIKPVPTDKASVARIKYMTYKDYLKEFDFLWETFSKEQVLKGSFDKFVQSNKGKKGTTGVDAEFLKSLDGWRDLLARNIVNRNQAIGEDELNYSLQKIIDRLIFLRICEDRGVEREDQLRNAMGLNAFENLKQIFHISDQKYNSGLFDYKKDTITDNLVIDDKILKSIIEEMYYPKSPYEFSVIPVEILGHSYEQYLGKVIKITPGHRIKIEEKPEVRKAGGVYYTPQYIVDYIVKNTVGKLVEGKTPEEVAKIKICDPACGSGSFLLGAYQYLLDWHSAYYQDGIGASPNASTPLTEARGLAHVKNNNFLTPDGHLTTSIKKQILLNNIHGVDIDTNAVEVTKLSLMLKAMEGETEASINNQLTLYHERVLPTLDNNIKSGNSLIDLDFYDGKIDFEPETEKKIKPFNWENAFPEVFKQGGFDAVIGNPPYVYIQDKIQIDYFSRAFPNQDYQSDLYLLFLERYEHLLKNNGLLGVIISNTWLQSLTMKKIRRYLINTYKWIKFLQINQKVFKAVVDTHVVLFEKSKLKNEILQIDILNSGIADFSHYVNQFELPDDGSVINLISNDNERLLSKKILQKSMQLSTFCDVFNGVKPFEKGKGKPPQTEITMKEKPFVKVKCEKPGDNWSPLLRGSLINRYVNIWNNDSWILYGEWLAAPRNPKIFQNDNTILVRQTGDSIISTLVTKGFISRDNLHIIINKRIEFNILFTLGQMNSKLMDFFYTNMNPEKGEALAQVKKMHVEMLPIYNINLSDVNEKNLYDQIIKLVESMLQLNKDLQKAVLPEQKEQIKARIDYTDKKIDKLVYELYGLTKEEIRIVEGE